MALGAAGTAAGAAEAVVAAVEVEVSGTWTKMCPLSLPAWSCLLGAPSGLGLCCAASTGGQTQEWLSGSRLLEAVLPPPWAHTLAWAPGQREHSYSHCGWEKGHDWMCFARWVSRDLAHPWAGGQKGRAKLCQALTSFYPRPL